MNQQDWRQWIESVYKVSEQRINYWNPLISEEIARTEHPKLYADYQSGISPEDFVQTHLVHYNEYLQERVAQIDPDDEALPDDEYQEEE